MVANLLCRIEVAGSGNVNPLSYQETAARLGSVVNAPLAPPGSEFAMLCSVRSTQLREVTETILFVEDEIFVREVVGEILRFAGYCVLRARTAEEAVGTYKEWDGKIDLLLTDVVLPGESGCILAKKLRREDPEIKVLFITGYVAQMGKRRAGEIGKDCLDAECLTKPFSAQALLQRVRSVLNETGIQRNSGNRFKHAAGNG
jgi:DNA-binding response OmpR family regulator